MSMKNLKAIDILEALESKLAYIPGGRDRDGRPLIVISVPPELDPTTKPKLESLILYFLSIFRYRISRYLTVHIYKYICILLVYIHI